jgi:AraC-like DNA-binding protein
MRTNGNEGFPYFTVNECFAGTIVNTPGCIYGPRMQRELQLVLLHTGSMRIDIDGTVNTILPGRVVIILPGQQVYIAFNEKEGTWHRWVTVITHKIKAEVLNEMEQLPRILPISKQMNQLIDILVDLQRQDISNDRTERYTLAMAAFQLYVSECRKGIISVIHPAIPLVKSLIHEQYHEDLELADLASTACVSPGHLIRLFRQQEAMTPTQYLWRYRIERGIELLRSTGLSIGEIADRCGYKTSYHFARQIKAIKGRTPTEIRCGN